MPQKFKAALSGLLIACAGLLLGVNAVAANAPPSPAPVSVISGSIPFTASTSTSPHALPSTNPAAIALTFYNQGANDVFCNTGASGVVATTSSKIRVPAGTSQAVWSSDAFVACVTTGSTSAVLVFQANGPLYFTSPAGSGGGGGGGAVTIADGADVTQGTIGDTHTAATNNGYLNGIYGALTTGPVPVTGSIFATNPSVGTNAATGPTSSTQIGGQDGSGNLQAGKIGAGTEAGAIRVTLPTDGTGVVTAKQATAANLNATVVGTGTLAVQNTAATPAGTNVIGHVIADTGSTTAVTQATASNLNATVVGTGTFATQSAQSGTWTVQPGNTPNTTAWKVDGSAVTQPVSAASLPLPSGAATAAKQPALGTAGSPSTDVITVQYPTSGGTAVPVTSGVAQASTTSGQTLSPVGMATLTSAPTYTTAQTNIPWLRTNGAQAHDIASINGTPVLAGTGAQGAGAQRVTVATDSATVAGSASLPAGTNVIGHVIADTGSTTAVTQATGTNLHTVTDSTSVSQAIPGTTGGLTVATITAANSTNATNLKSTAGQLYHITGYSAAAVPTWVSFYNTSGTPTCGTGIVYQMLIPVNATSGGGAVDDIPSGLAFSSGIGYCITTGIAGTGSVAATSVNVNFGYK